MRRVGSHHDRTIYAAVVSILVALVSGPAAAELVTGARGAVAAEHRLASSAGVEILNAGGNAVDAAVAASLATGVVNPSSAGLGGGGFMVVYTASDARAHTIDYRETAPAAAHRDMYVAAGVVDRTASKTGGRAVAVPGEPAGLALALERLGTMTLAQVAAPALRLAREGFTVEAHLASSIARARDALAGDRGLRQFFLRADGTPYEQGDVLRRPALASALEALATSGAQAFYTGGIGQEIVATVQSRGGVLTASDLADYAPVQRPPVVVRYERWQIVGMPPPSSGGGLLGSVLGVIEPFSLRDLGHNTTTYLHLLAESLKAAFADRALYYGDPDFVDVPLPRLLSPAHTSSIRARITARGVVPASEYGRRVVASDAGTAHISVVDAAGNAVACTTSINTSFGSKVGVPGRGIVLNNTMDDFSLQPGIPNVYGLLGSEANSIRPGKRPLSSMSPTIVLEDGRPRLAVGASGGPLIITATLQTLLNVLEFGMDPARAIAAPRIHNQWMPDLVLLETGMPAVVGTSLARRGHNVVPLRHGAAVQAVELTNADGDGRVRAASDERKGGIAAAQ